MRGRSNSQFSLRLIVLVGLGLNVKGDMRGSFLWFFGYWSLHLLLLRLRRLLLDLLLLLSLLNLNLLLLFRLVWEQRGEISEWIRGHGS